MKKKMLTFALLGVLGVSSIIPTVANGAETWNYGYNKSSMQWYNHYYHSDLRHYGSITKNGTVWYGLVANGGYWSKLNINFDGPYAVSYNKHIVR
jgi:hypothetical protein